MNIEDKLKNVPVHSSSHHRAVLRTRLLAHEGEIRMKKPSFKRWAVIAVPAFAVLVLAVFAVLPITKQANKTDNIVQQTIRNLTPQQVFAAAARQISTSELEDGKYYYLKEIRYYDSSCERSTEFYETYTNNDRIVKDISRNSSDELMRVNSYQLQDGIDMSTNEYFDADAIFRSKSNNITPGCEAVTVLSDAESEIYRSHSIKVANAFGYAGTEAKPAELGAHLYFGKLRMGVPEIQTEVFNKLSTVDDWAIYQNQKIDGYEKPVIKLQFAVDDKLYEKLYFDQETKQFVGYDMKHDVWGLDSVRVLKQDVREMPSAITP